MNALCGCVDKGAAHSHTVPSFEAKFSTQATTGFPRNFLQFTTSSRCVCNQFVPGHKNVVIHHKS